MFQSSGVEAGDVTVWICVKRSFAEAPLGCWWTCPGKVQWYVDIGKYYIIRVIFLDLYEGPEWARCGEVAGASCPEHEEG